MKIAYLVHWDLSKETGVLKKIREQMSCWRALGHEVRLIALAPTAEVWSGLEGLDAIAVPRSGRWSRWRQGRTAARLAREWAPDLVYTRFGPYHPALDSLSRSFPTVLELNTDDRREFGLLLPRYKYLYHLATRSRLLERSRGMVAVTHELARAYGGHGAPVTVIANGIDLSAYPELPPAPRTGAAVRAVFIGAHDAVWHGVDKIVTLARQLPDWHFDLIGPSLAAAPPNVTAHGPLARREYESLMAGADLAIGTLALHRKEMYEACPLKVREYLAYGIPCIIGYRDTDFPEAAPYLLELPNTADNVLGSIAEIREFGERVKGTRVSRGEIEHLDFGRKERVRLEFFEAVRRDSAE